MASTAYDHTIERNPNACPACQILRTSHAREIELLKETHDVLIKKIGLEYEQSLGNSKSILQNEINSLTSRINRMIATEGQAEKEIELKVAKAVASYLTTINELKDSLHKAEINHKDEIERQNQAFETDKHQFIRAFLGKYHDTGNEVVDLRARNKLLKEQLEEKELQCDEMVSESAEIRAGQRRDMEELRVLRQSWLSNSLEVERLNKAQADSIMELTQVRTALEVDRRELYEARTKDKQTRVEFNNWLKALQGSTSSSTSTSEQLPPAKRLKISHSDGHLPESGSSQASVTSVNKGVMRTSNPLNLSAPIGEHRSTASVQPNIPRRSSDTLTISDDNGHSDVTHGNRLAPESRSSKAPDRIVRSGLHKDSDNQHIQDDADTIEIVLAAPKNQTKHAKPKGVTATTEKLLEQFQFKVPQSVEIIQQWQKEFREACRDESYEFLKDAIQKLFDPDRPQTSYDPARVDFLPWLSREAGNKSRSILTRLEKDKTDRREYCRYHTEKHRPGLCVYITLADDIDVPTISENIEYFVHIRD